MNKLAYILTLMFLVQSANASSSTTCRQKYYSEVQKNQIKLEGLKEQYEQLTGKVYGEEDENSGGSKGTFAGWATCLIGTALTLPSGVLGPSFICGFSVPTGLIADGIAEIEDDKSMKLARSHKGKQLAALMEKISGQEMMLASISGVYNLAFGDGYREKKLFVSKVKEIYGERIDVELLSRAQIHATKNGMEELCRDNKLVDLVEFTHKLYEIYKQAERDRAAGIDYSYVPETRKAIPPAVFPKYPTKNGEQVIHSIGERGL